MRAMVEVRWGRAHGQKAVLEPGTSLRVGRTKRADFVVEEDRQMSGLHFEIKWDGARCALRDLNSMKGTLLNGERVGEAAVEHGDWIQAGSTNLMVYFEEKTRARRGADVEMTTAKAAALAGLEAEVDPLFAVLDAARDERILELVRESVEDCRSLYEGAKGDALAEKAPYLVALPKGTRLLRRLVAEGWGKRWGIFLTSRRPFKEVRTHLRRYLMVSDDQAQSGIYFRFYDPGALRAVWPTTSPRQQSYFFTDLESALFEDTDGALTRIVARTGAVEGTWRISKPQMEAIGQAMAMEDLERSTSQRIRSIAPYRWEPLHDRGVRRVVRLGVNRASAYGVTDPGLLRLYIDIMFLYGSFFDTDPLFSWAADVLQDDTMDNHQVRMDRLHKRMSEYYDRVSGPHEAFDHQALLSAEWVFRREYPADSPRFEMSLVGELFDAHSRRATYLGEQRLRTLVGLARGGAAQLGLGGNVAVPLVAFLMFTLGHRFTEDPALPWVANALRGSNGVERLEQEFLGYRDRVLKDARPSEGVRNGEA